MSESAINAIKKSELAQKIIALNGKFLVDSDISNLRNQISKLNDRIFQLHSTNEKIRSEVTVVKNVNTKRKEQIISLKKIKPNPSSTAGVITLNDLVFRMIYRKMISRKW